MSDVTVSISQTPQASVTVTLVEDDFPIQVGYDPNDVIPGPTGPDGPPGPPGPGGDATIEEVLTNGNDAGGLEIKNIAAPSENGSATNKQYVDTQISSAIIAQASAFNSALTSEANARTSADTLHSSQIESLQSNYTSQQNQIGTLEDDLAAEASARAVSDGTLQDQLDALDQLVRNNLSNVHFHGILESAVSIGQIVYLDSDGLLKPFNLTSGELVNKQMGVVLKSYGASDEAEVYCLGLVSFEEAILTPGKVYYSSNTGVISMSTSSLIVGVSVNESVMFVDLRSVNSAGSVAWEDVTGKPSTFPPEAHTHPWGDVTGKPSTFTPEAHTHPWGDVTGKPSTFTPEAHTHNASDINDGVFANARLGSGATEAIMVPYADQVWRSPMDYKQLLFEHFNHFITTAANSQLESIANSGTGAGLTGVNAVDPFGVVRSSTGTTATGYQMIRLVNNSAFMNKATTKVARVRMRIPTLSDGTNTFIWRATFSNTISGADGSQSVGFRYTHSENGGNFTCVTRQNNTESSANSGVAVVANTWFDLRVEFNTTDAKFYIDNVLVATITTNLPTDGGAQFFGFALQIVKSVGTTARTVDYDYYHLKVPTY